MNQINNGNQTNDFPSAMFNESNKDMIWTKRFTKKMSYKKPNLSDFFPVFREQRLILLFLFKGLLNNPVKTTGTNNKGFLFGVYWPPNFLQKRALLTSPKTWRKNFSAAVSAET